MSSNPEDLVKSVSTLASLPSIYNRLSEVISHPLSSSRDIGGVVAEDPGLTARVLKLVNSAFYGFPKRIDTITRAITIVGTQQLCDLALATSVIKAFQTVPQDLVDMDSFWKHSLACGVCARTIAGLRREDNVERFFVAGMLHDIGLPILYMKQPEKSRFVLEHSKTSGELLQDVENSTFGFNHAEVGRCLLQAWHLPDSLQEAVHFHHNPAKASHFPIEATTVHVADIIATALEMGNSGEFWVQPLESNALDLLGIDLNQLPNLLEEIERQYNEVIKIMLTK